MYDWSNAGQFFLWTQIQRPCVLKTASMLAIKAPWKSSFGLKIIRIMQINRYAISYITCSNNYIAEIIIKNPPNNK